MRMTASWFGSWTHRIQGCGAIDLRARKAGSPLIVIPIASSVPPCSELSRYGLASPKLVERLVRRPTLTAPARARLCNTAGRGEETGFPGRTKKPMKKARKRSRLKPLDNRNPIQAPTARPKVPMRRLGAHCLVVVMKRGNARGAKGVGHQRWIGSTGNGRSPIINGRRQPSLGGTSRMMREYHVRICEGLGVKFPGSTRPA